MKTLLDVCSGIGGFSLAMKHLVGDYRTIGYIEIERYCREILRARIRDGILDDAPIFHDLRGFAGERYRGKVDCLSAGFPCQPFSVAGKQLGEQDERNLWPELARVIREVLPATVFLENVPTLLAGPDAYAGQVFGNLAESGYDCRWDCIPASAVGANHQRDRLWILAHTNQAGLGQRRERYSEQDRRVETSRRDNTRGRGKDVADATRERLNGAGAARERRRAESENVRWWLSEPDVGRVANGVPARVDRLKALGNAIVPEVAHKAWEALK